MRLIPPWLTACHAHSVLHGPNELNQQQQLVTTQSKNANTDPDQSIRKMSIHKHRCTALIHWGSLAAHCTLGMHRQSYIALWTTSTLNCQNLKYLKDILQYSRSYMLCISCDQYLLLSDEISPSTGKLYTPNRPQITSLAGYACQISQLTVYVVDDRIFISRRQLFPHARWYVPQTTRPKSYVRHTAWLVGIS